MWIYGIIGAFTVYVGYCMTYDINLTHPLISARDDLLKSLNELEIILEKIQPPVWIPAEWINPSILPIRQVSKHISTVKYLNEQDSTSTTTLPGIVIANDQILDAVNNVNKHKLLFAETIKLTKQNTTLEIYKLIKAKVLDHYQFNLKQAVRSLHVIHDSIDSASLCWVKGDKVVKKVHSNKDLLNWVACHFVNEQRQEEAINTLSSLPIDKLAIIRTAAPYISGCFRLSDNKTRSKRPIKIKIHSPVFLTNNKSLPTVKKDLPKTRVEKNRATRSDAVTRHAVFDGFNLFIEV